MISRQNLNEILPILPIFLVFLYSTLNFGLIKIILMYIVWYFGFSANCDNRNWRTTSLYDSPCSLWHSKINNYIPKIFFSCSIGSILMFPQHITQLFIGILNLLAPFKTHSWTKKLELKRHSRGKPWNAQVSHDFARRSSRKRVWDGCHIHQSSQYPIIK